MHICKCGGTIRQHKLTETVTTTREAWTCNSCGRYEQIERSIPDAIMKTLVRANETDAQNVEHKAA